MASRLVNLLTFGLASRRSASVDGLSTSTSASASHRLSTLRGEHGGDYSSYSNDTLDAFPTDPSLSTSHSPSRPPSPDPHEAYILPPSFPSPTNAASSITSSSSSSLSPQPPSSIYSTSSSLTPVLTGDATLDIYKTELDLLSREVEHIRGSISAYAKQIIRMGLQATDVAEKAYDVCEAANFFPPGMKVFMKVHRGWSEEAAYLFAGQLEEEVMQPLKEWDERVDAFIRELMRVNQVRLTMNEHRKRVDALFLKKCDAPKTWSEEEELELKVGKSDLEATCNHYTGRCEGLVSHWKSLALDRMNALDLLFTRLMAQQFHLFHPAIQALKVSGIGASAGEGRGEGTAQETETAKGEVAAPGEAQGPAVRPEASPLTPPTPSGRLRAYSGDGLNVRKRSHDLFDDSERLATQLNHFTAPKVLRKREAERLKKERERREREEAEDDSDDEDKQDAILRTLELMKEEIREKERLQREMEQLIAQQQKAQETKKEEESEEAQRLRERLRELELRLEEKEAEIARDQRKIEEAKEAETADGNIVGADAPPPPPFDGDIPGAPPLDGVPPAPPMDGVPSAPPMDGIPPPPPMGDVPMAPPPPGGPVAPTFAGLTLRKLTPRDKEIAEARKYALPLLPKQETMGEGVAVKRLHWTVVGGGEVKGTVWEELFKGKVEGQEVKVEDWESPLIRKDADDSSLTSPRASSSPFEWQWPLDEEFGLTFAQKSAKPMARKARKKKRRGGAASTTQADDDDDAEDAFDEDDEAQLLREAAEARLKKAIERVELIDAKRAYNVSISLSRFRLDYPLIRNAVMLMDGELLSLEMLEVLADILPTAEEMKLVKEYEGDVEMLGDVERFFLTMSVPTLSTRLRSFLFLQSFSAVTSALQDALDGLQRVNERLRESKGLRGVLGVVLRMGNFMTASNGQPQVYGFHLSTLLKLRGVKSVDNKSTLLHFLVHYTHQHCPQLRHFTNDLAGCRAASRVESAFLVAEVKQLQQNLKMVRQLIEADEKRRGMAAPSIASMASITSRFNFQPGAAATPSDGFTVPFTPLSAPAFTPLHLTQPSPSPNGPSSTLFSFNTDLATPASAMIPPSTLPEDALPPLPERLYTFYAYARQRVGEIERQLGWVQRQYAELQRLLVWEDGAWESLYALMAEFVEEWLGVEQEQEMARQAEVRKRKQLEATEAMQRKKREANAHKEREKEREKEGAGQQHQRGRSTSSTSLAVGAGEWVEESKGEKELGASHSDSGSSTPPVFSLELEPMDHEALP